MADNTFDPERLRKRFHALTDKAAGIRAKSDPLREKRDRLSSRHAKEIEKHNAALLKAEDGLAEVEQERAMIARALGGRVGEAE